MAMIQMFLGTTGSSGTLSAYLTDGTNSDFALFTASYASIRVHNDGTVDYGNSNFGGAYVYTNQYTWKTGGGTNADYQARWTNSIGTASGPTAGTWFALSSTLEWYVATSGGNYQTTSAVGTLEIRMTASPNTVLATASITLEAVTEI